MTAGFVRDRGDGGRRPAAAGDPRACARRAAVVSHRRAAGGMDRARPHAGGARRRRRHRVSRVALGPAARLHARRLCAPARHRAPGRRIFRRHACDGGTDRAGRRALRPDQFRDPAGITEKRAPLVFWTLLQGIQAALSLIFLGGDLFNLYVGLELLTFAAVPLVCLDGRPETVAAALRYLLFALFGSVFYLLGVALLYGAYGTLDIALLAPLVRPEPAVWLAAGLMTAGLLAKTALFPLHLWLPPAHANAPAAASAVLSGLVVKGSFFLVVRLWFDVLAALPGVIPGHDPRRARFGCNPVRQRACPASGAAEIAHRLFDRSADRLPLHDVPAGRRPVGGGRLQRRRDAGDFARLRQGGDVPVRRPHRRVRSATTASPVSAAPRAPCR